MLKTKLRRLTTTQKVDNFLSVNVMVKLGYRTKANDASEPSKSLLNIFLKFNFFTFSFQTYFLLHLYANAS